MKHLNCSPFPTHTNPFFSRTPCDSWPSCGNGSDRTAAWSTEVQGAAAHRGPGGAPPKRSHTAMLQGLSRAVHEPPAQGLCWKLPGAGEVQVPAACPAARLRSDKAHPVLRPPPASRLLTKGCCGCTGWRPSVCGCCWPCCCPCCNWKKGGVETRVLLLARCLRERPPAQPDGFLWVLYRLGSGLACSTSHWRPHVGDEPHSAPVLFIFCHTKAHEAIFNIQNI